MAEEKAKGRRYVVRSIHSDAIHQMFAGGVSGGISAIATAPLDLAKTRMQVQYTPKGTSATAKYRGLWSTLHTTLRDEGPKGWFKGLGACLLGLVPSWTIYFTCYNTFKRMLLETDIAERTLKSTNFISNLSDHTDHDHDDHINRPVEHSHILTKSEAHMLAAMGAGMINATLTNPLWVVKVRMQTQFASTNPESRYRYTSIPGAFRTIVKEEGFRGLFKGLPVSLFGTIHVVIQFPLYEYLKESYRSEDQEVHLKGILTASIVSKLVASSITYPHELLRSRFQRQRVQRYHSIGDALVKIFREEGPIAFYRGMVTNLIRVVPTCAITFTVYEYALRFINKVDP